MKNSTTTMKVLAVLATVAGALGCLWVVTEDGFGFWFMMAGIAYAYVLMRVQEVFDNTFFVKPGIYLVDDYADQASHHRTKATFANSDDDFFGDIGDMDTYRKEMAKADACWAARFDASERYIRQRGLQLEREKAERLARLANKAHDAV